LAGSEWIARSYALRFQFDIEGRIVALTFDVKSAAVLGINTKIQLFLATRD
jgi:hypothetical protein